jgi:hypothetical protein
VEAIDDELRAREPLAAVARKFRVGIVTLAAHKASCADLRKRPEPDPEPAGTPEPGDPEEGPILGPALPKNRAAPFQSLTAAAYVRKWTMFPTEIARALTPGERHYPEGNPLHPNADSLPPEAPRRMRRAGPIGGARLDGRPEGDW